MKLPASVAALAALTVVVCSTTGALADVQSKAQQACINALNGKAAKVAQQQGKENLRCLKDAFDGDLATTAQACFSADRDGHVGDSTAATLAAEAKQCVEELPEFAHTGAAFANAAARLGRLHLVADLFTGAADAALASCTTDPAACTCQGSLAKGADALARAKELVFLKCKRSVLKADAASAADVAACVSDPDTEGSLAADSKGKLEKAVGLLATKIAKSCDESGATAASVLLSPACSGLAGEALAACIDRISDCRVCQWLDAADGLGIDCDQFDDGALNGTCAPPLFIAQGDACAADLSCVTQHCVAGVCCDETCDAGCESCQFFENGVADGVCAPALSGADPGGDCADLGAATCGLDGACNGTGGCRSYGIGTVCAAGSCNALVYNLPDLCAAEACQDQGAQSCDDGNICTTDTCLPEVGCGNVDNTASCDDGQACTVTDTCAGGSCLGTQLVQGNAAAITKEITSIDAEDQVHLEVEITNLNNKPFSLTAIDVSNPQGLALESLVSVCETDGVDPTRNRCRHTMHFLATAACQGDGSYSLFLDHECSPDVAECTLCSAPRTIDFTLDTSNWCTESTAFACGDGAIEEGEQCDLDALGGKTCVTEGYRGGTLACNGLCAFDTSGCQSVRAFVTSTTYNGNLGGLAGADAKCQTRADAAGLGGVWNAWLSTSTTDARERVPAVEYRTMIDTVFTDDGADLYDGTLDANIDRDEFGNVAFPNIWTGTNNDGTRSGATCSDWSSSGGGVGTHGKNDFPPASGIWSSFDNAFCSNTLRLYCFERSAYKRVFLTSQTYQAVLGGLAGADAKCQAAANTASRGGTWKAWLSTSTTDAKDRVPNEEYRLVDRSTVIANNKADLLDGTIDTSIVKDELGATRLSDVWSGTGNDGNRTSGFTCADWTSFSLTETAIAGRNNAIATWSLRGEQSCPLPARLYCFEQ